MMTMRERIRPLTVAEARRMGITKSISSYLRKIARSDRPLLIYQEVRDRITHFE